MGHCAPAGPRPQNALAMGRAMGLAHDVRPMGMSYVLWHVLCPMSRGPVLCSMALSHVLWPCHMSHSPVLCPLGMLLVMDTIA